jgi:hypothetical protein
MDQMLRNGAASAEGAVADRRLHARVARPPVHVSGPAITVNDVSLGGINLTCEHTAQVGDLFELILTDAMLSYTETLEAEVMWRTRIGLGLRWINVTERQEKWLRDRLDAWTANHRSLVVSGSSNRSR